MGSGIDTSVSQAPPSEDWYFKRSTGWKKVFCFLPKKCHLTGERIWFKVCYRGMYLITGPGTPVVGYFHVKSDEFLIWNLTR